MSGKLFGRGLETAMPSYVAKLVLLKLLDACEPDGTRIFPGIKSIARAAMVSERQAQRVMKLFVGKGLLILVEKGGRGPGDTAQYRLDMALFERLVEDGWSNVFGDTAGALRGPHEGQKEGDAASPLEGDISRAKGDTKGDAQMSPDPIDPSTDPLRESAGARDEQDHLPNAPWLDEIRSKAETTPYDSRDEVETEWRKLSVSERKAALDHYGSWRAGHGRVGRTKIAGLAVYLREKRWEALAAKAKPAAAAAAWVGAFDRAWWWLFFAYVERHLGELFDRDSQPSILLRKRATLAVTSGIGWPLDGMDAADLETRAAGLVKVHKDDPRARAWQHRCGVLGVALPIPDTAQWIYVPEGEAADWCTGTPLLSEAEMDEVMGT